MAVRTPSDPSSSSDSDGDRGNDLWCSDAESSSAETSSSESSSAETSNFLWSCECSPLLFCVPWAGAFGEPLPVTRTLGINFPISRLRTRGLRLLREDCCCATGSLRCQMPFFEAIRWLLAPAGRFIGEWSEGLSLLLPESSAAGSGVEGGSLSRVCVTCLRLAVTPF